MSAPHTAGLYVELGGKLEKGTEQQEQGTDKQRDGSEMGTTQSQSKNSD